MTSKGVSVCLHISRYLVFLDSLCIRVRGFILLSKKMEEQRKMERVLLISFLVMLIEISRSAVYVTIDYFDIFTTFTYS